MSFHLHETLYRGEALMERLKTSTLVLCGAGALGANLCETLARTGCQKLRLIDRDRIEEGNLSTQPYSRSEIGSHKAKVLSHNLYRAVGVTVEAHCLELNAQNVAKLLKGAALVVDCFDNHESRRLVSEACRDVPCLHAGMASDYAEVLWNEGYRVPHEVEPDRCDYPLARTLVGLTVALTAEIALQFLATGEKLQRTLTLRDLALRDYA